MNCGCFADTLHYASPANGGRGVVRTGMMVPESVQLFVCPFACGRHGAISIMKQEMKRRLAYLYVDQSDVISGYDDLIPPAVEEFLQALPARPRVVLVFVSCLDDLIGTDNDALEDTLHARFPGIRFRVCHMNPISLGSATPPGVSIQNKMYSLLEGGRTPDRGVNCLGNLAQVDPRGEIHAFLAGLGLGELRHISRYTSFEDYQQMGSSCLNLVIAPQGKQAAGQLERRLGIPMLTLPVSYRLEEIEAGYRSLARWADTAWELAPDLTPWRDRALAAAERARARVGEIPLVVDASAFQRPFGAARALLEYGFCVARVQAGECIPWDEEHLAWLREHAPQVEILQSNHHRVVRFEGQLPHSLAVGVDGAYLAGSRYAADVFNDEGLLGYHGVITLMERLEQALDAPADVRKMIHEYGLVV